MARVLIITPLGVPDPKRDHHGVFQRLRLFVQALAATGRAVEIAHFAAPDADDDDAARDARDDRSSRFWGAPVRVRLLPLDLAARPRWRRAAALVDLRERGDFRPYLGQAAVMALRDLLATSPDLVFAHRLPAMELLRAAGATRPAVFDLDDVEHLVKLRAAASAREPARALRLRWEAAALLRAERRAVAAARLTFLCSRGDRDRLAQSGFDVGRVAVAPNAVAMPDACPPAPAEPNALYIGNYGHAPNAEAAERLITLIWPQVRAALPEARLIVAGDAPERIPSFREEPEGVVFTGLVQDLDALYGRARIVCCPLVNGGGTRLKLIEAAGRGLAIVATRIAAEGLALRDGREILLRDDDVGLARACVELLADPARARAQAEAAFARASSMHRPADVVALIRDALDRALQASPGTAGPRARPSRGAPSLGLGGLMTDAAER